MEIIHQKTEQIHPLIKSLKSREHKREKKFEGIHSLEMYAL